MLILIIACGVIALAHRHLQKYAPSNTIVARIRQERPRFRLTAGLGLSAAIAAGAVVLTDWLANGGPGFLNLIVLIAIWDAMKFAWLAALTPPPVVVDHLPALRRLGAPHQGLPLVADRERARIWTRPG